MIVVKKEVVIKRGLVHKSCTQNILKYKMYKKMVFSATPFYLAIESSSTTLYYILL